MIALLHSPRLIAAGVVLHCVAILCTLFRLVYRIWMRLFWWEDAWAAFALVLDVLCLACFWIDKSISSWILAVTLTSVVWAARMSIIFSIIRVTKDSAPKIHRQVTHLIAVSFACMWAAIIVQKTSVCNYHACQMARSLAISQLITAIISDVSLVAVPLYLWKNVGLSRGRKILITSTISSSLLITVITIPHSIMLFRSHTRSILIFAHIKSALSLIVCDLLVIVTFVYRVCFKEAFDVDNVFGSAGHFTSVIVVQQLSSTNAERSTSAREGTTAIQITSVQIGATDQLKPEDASVFHGEYGTSTGGHMGTLNDGTLASNDRSQGPNPMY